MRNIAQGAPFLQQQLGCLHAGIQRKAGHHPVVIQGVGQRDERHPLVVRHVGAHDDRMGDVGHAGLRAWSTCGVVDGVEEPVIALEAEGGKASEVQRALRGHEHRGER